MWKAICGTIGYDDVESKRREHERIQKIRAQIDGFLDSGDWDGLVAVNGIRMMRRINPNVDPLRENDCFKYVEDQTGIACDLELSKGSIGSRNLIPLSHPQEGDIIAYFDHSMSIPRHVGVYLGGGKVRSKWGTGHIYEHNVDYVPTSYGFDVRFFRKTAIASPV